LLGEKDDTMNVQYWAIGVGSMTPLSMSQNDISTHLSHDWVPSLPAAVSSSFVGWPSFLIEGVNIQSVDFLTLLKEVGGTERQWKGFLSWMLGVAGTRHVLAQEGYQWIAPISAFYRNSMHPVSLVNWNPSFPQSIVEAKLPLQPITRLRPDYLAIKMDPSGSISLAIAEAKGTKINLNNMHLCPPNWKNQAHNIEILVNGNLQKIARYIVVATRVNPNAINKSTRRIQIRAWNSSENTTEQKLLQYLAVDVVSAHLFGLFRNLGLRENARAIADSVHTRYEHTSIITDYHRRNAEILRKRADFELETRSTSWKANNDPDTPIVINTDNELGQITFEISGATISLAKKLSLALNLDQAAEALYDSRERILRWWKSQDKLVETAVVLNSGVLVRFPERI
jgi:hypothetical protein